jgi:exopolysaccharide production protein ExoQ
MSIKLSFNSMFKNSYPLLTTFETIYVRFSLFHLSGALLPLILTGGSSEGDGLDINTVDLSLVAKIDLLVYFVAGVLVTLRWKKALNFASKNLYFFPFIVFASFSYFWSFLPEETFKGVVYALGTTVFGIYLASRYTIKEQLTHLAWALGFITILSALFAVAIPYYGLMGGVHQGAVRGIYVHKNVFSPIIVLAVMVFFLKAFEANERKWVYWGLFMLIIALGIMSRSSTALGLMFVMLTLCLSYRILRWRYEMLVSTILLIIILGSGGLVWFVEFGGAELLFEALGKDATLSSRTEIWTYVWDSILQQPWFGHGLGGYWNGLDGPSAYVQRAMRLKVHYAHNGFLDLCLNYGFIGFSLFFANLLLVASRSLSVLRRSNTVEGFWPLLWLTYMILTNLTEGSLSSLNSMTWALYTTIAFSLAAMSEKSRKMSLTRA